MPCHASHVDQVTIKFEVFVSELSPSPRPRSFCSEATLHQGNYRWGVWWCQGRVKKNSIKPESLFAFASVIVRRVREVWLGSSNIILESYHIVNNSPCLADHLLTFLMYLLGTYISNRMNTLSSCVSFEVSQKKVCFLSSRLVVPPAEDNTWEKVDGNHYILHNKGECQIPRPITRNRIAPC